FTPPAPTARYPLSLHDALPICDRAHPHQRCSRRTGQDRRLGEWCVDHAPRAELLLEAEGHLERATVHVHVLAEHEDTLVAPHLRSEEHTSELQSRRDLVCRLLL